MQKRKGNIVLLISSLLLIVVIAVVGISYFWSKNRQNQPPVITNYAGSKNKQSICFCDSYKFQVQKNAAQNNPVFGPTYAYDLLRTDSQGKQMAVYTITNYNGFRFQISEDCRFIAFLNYGPSLGDESLSLTTIDGRILKTLNNSDLNNVSHITDIGWSGHDYWVIEGDPNPIAAARINADTLVLTNFKLSTYTNLQNNIPTTPPDVTSGEKPNVGSYQGIPIAP